MKKASILIILLITISITWKCKDKVKEEGTAQTESNPKLNIGDTIVTSYDSITGEKEITVVKPGDSMIIYDPETEEQEVVVAE